MNKLLEKLFPKKARKFATPSILTLVNLYLYANSAALFGQQFAAQWSNVFLFYVLMGFGAFVINAFQFVKPAGAPLSWQIVVFVGGAAAVFFATAILGLNQIGALKPQVTFSNALPAIALEISTGGTEEVFFRGALGERLGPVWSSLLFGVWHASAYGLDPYLIGIAVVLGFVLFFIWDSTRDQFGSALNGAVHVGLNLAKILPLAAVI